MKSQTAVEKFEEYFVPERNPGTLKKIKINHLKNQQNKCRYKSYDLFIVLRVYIEQATKVHVQMEKLNVYAVAEEMKRI